MTQRELLATDKRVLSESDAHDAAKTTELPHETSDMK